jgi:predicted amidohydrolase YtcJ
MPRWVFTFLLCACLQGAAFAGATDERVLYNGKVFTGEPEHPYAEAVAIRNDKKIVAVGNRGEVSKAVTSGVEMIDLKGNFLVPGMIDSHCHAVDGGRSLISADVGREREVG